MVRSVGPDLDNLDECREAWFALGRLMEDGLWGRVDLAFAIDAKHGREALSQFAEAVGYERAAMYRLLQVQRAFPDAASRRLDGHLSLYHHVEALRAKEPQRALDLAVREGLNVRELRAAVRAHPDDLAAVTKDAARALVEAAAARQRKSPVPAPEPAAQAKGAAPAPERQPQTNDVRDVYALVRFIIRNYERDEIDRLCGLLSNAEAAA